MPQQPPPQQPTAETLEEFDVKFPDGKIQTFRGPSTMTEDQILQRAAQERAFAEKRIPTTYREGVRQGVGQTLIDKSGMVGTGVGLVGALAGQPEVVAASPFIGRATKTLGERMSGQPLTTPSLPEAATLAAEGAVGGYGPKYAGQALRAYASEAAAVRPSAGGHGLLPWNFLIRMGGRAATPAAEMVEQATPKAINAAVRADVKALTDTAARVRAGVSVDDLKLLADNINNGMNPATAARIVANGDKTLANNLLKLYMRSRMRP